MKRVSILTVAMLMASLGTPAGTQTSPSRVVNVVAERFSFTPSEVSVPQGTVVEFRLTSEDTAHGFHIIGPGNINVEIPKRGRGDIRVTFDAKEPGRYTFECSRVCGAGHSFMRGTIRVIPPDAAAN